MKKGEDIEIMTNLKVAIENFYNLLKKEQWKSKIILRPNQNRRQLWK